MTTETGDTERERWLERYGDWYRTEADRAAAYADYVRNRGDVRRGFGLEEDG